MSRKEPGVADLTLLDTTLNELSVSENLQKRFLAHCIYTYVGNVVIAINPYQTLDLYNDEIIHSYHRSYSYDMSPHIFALAENAHHNMMQYQRDQCILICGESGSGKTETSKLILKYLATISYQKNKTEQIKDHLLKCNPILEAFGNAKTIRNNNSSRFGKYADICFDGEGATLGGQMKTYLLEKSRIVHPSKNERNYHIFYYLLECNERYLKLDTKDPKKYEYLSQSGCYTIEKVNDAEQWNMLKDTFASTNWTDHEMQTVFKVVSAVLQSGNIEIVDFTSSSASDRIIKCSDIGLSYLKKVCQLLEIDHVLLERALLERSVTTSKDATVVTNNYEKAVQTKLALSKVVYERLFDYIVDRLNVSIRYDRSNLQLSTLMGILDIYGFEVFEKNYFEQYCINYCNEKLQQIFIELTLKSEQEEYLRENIEWEPVQYFNNAIICDLIEHVPKGMMTVIDECGIMPGKSTDKTLLNALDIRFKDHAHYQSKENNKTDKSLVLNTFRLKHYAGDVTYDIEGFLNCNFDNLSKDLKHCLYHSKNSIISNMFRDGADVQQIKKRPLSTLTSFKSSLKGLTDSLLTKNPHYVRCIKPNMEQKKDMFDLDLVSHQVRYLGLVENIRVRKAGFVYRETFKRFLLRYRILCPEIWSSLNQNQEQLCQMIFKKFKFVAVKDYQFGLCKVFIRKPSTVVSLEESREKQFLQYVPLMQKMIRGYLARCKLRKLKAKQMVVCQWKKFKGHQFICQYIFAYGNLSATKDFGAKIEPPTAAIVLTRFAAHVHRIYLNWKALKLLTPYSEEQRLLMRYKIDAYNIHQEMKKPWDNSAIFSKDCLTQKLANEHQQKLYSDYLQQIEKSKSSKEINPLLMASFVQKLSSSFVSQQRILVISQNSLNIVNASKQFKSHRLSPQGLSWKDVVNVGVSCGHDSIAVINTQKYGSFICDCYNTVLQKNCLAMCIATMSFAYRASQHKNLTFITEKSPTSSVKFSLPKSSSLIMIESELKEFGPSQFIKVNHEKIKAIQCQK